MAANTVRRIRHQPLEPHILLDAAAAVTFADSTSDPDHQDDLQNQIALLREQKALEQKALEQKVSDPRSEIRNNLPGAFPGAAIDSSEIPAAGNFRLEDLGAPAALPTDLAPSALVVVDTGDSLTDTFIVTAGDDVTTTTITITINGLGNDVPDLTGATATLTEDTDLDDNGNLMASGIVTGNVSGAPGFTAATLTGDVGTLTIDGEGAWAYTADNSQAAIQDLNTGDSLTDTFIVTSVGGATTITITINGLGNDVPDLTGAATTQMEIQKLAATTKEDNQKLAATTQMDIQKLATQMAETKSSMLRWYISTAIAIVLLVASLDRLLPW